MRDDSAGPFAAALDRHESASPAPPDPHIQRLWNESLDINDMAIMEQNDMTQLRTMLGIERISAETLSRYNVRGHVDKSDQAAILYPKYRSVRSRNRIPEGLKLVRKVGNGMEKEDFPFMDESSTDLRFCGMFGYHMTTPSDRVVVLTTNERDALAIHEATNGTLAFTLPRGPRVDLSVLPYLEDFEQIF
ncbi:hypothetical protein ANCDUO_19979, partial [Ancylostoma duodenale]